MRFGHHPGKLKRSDSLRSTDRRKAVEKLVKRVAGLKVLVQGLQGDPRPDEDRGPSQNFRVAVNDAGGVDHGSDADDPVYAWLLRRAGVLRTTDPWKTALAGLRIGDLLALRWRSLDLNIGTLMVRESVYEGKIQQPKTLKARRTIPLGPHAIALLREHRDRSTRMAADDFVFPNGQGGALRESKVLRRVLQPAPERAGLGRVTWRQFRHIHSLLLNDLRVPVKIAQEQLGHASISTTLNIYTHVVDASHRSAIQAVERQLFPTVPKSQSGDTKEEAVSDVNERLQIGGAARI